MAREVRVEITAFGGPSLHAPFAAVTAHFQNPFPSPLPAETLRPLCAELPARLRRRLAIGPGETAFDQLAAALANAFQDLNGPQGLPVEVRRSGNGTSRIVLGYHDATASTKALQAGIELAVSIFSRATGRPVAAQSVADVVRQMTQVMRAYQPDSIARALIRAARRRGIPVSPVAPGSRIWLYGQGRAGFHFFEAGNQRDSMTGERLATNKILSNQLVTRLGFPGVVHAVADSAGAAVELARKLGFPVVVKPVGGHKGGGVTAQIRTEDELRDAYAKAHAISPGGVIVERHVTGDDHRLAVFGGRFAWASRRSLPRVTGDGTHTIAELIEIENRTRSDEAVAAGFVARLSADADALEMLRNQGLQLHDRPAAGINVLLRSTANMATGGSIADCTAAIHPDNREMAEAIARCFRLDAVGIDFMTPDIGKSWRTTHCAVTEVNTTPGISFEARAETILRARFPDGDDGRIPCIVLIGGGGEARELVANALAAAGRRVGQTDATVTLLSGEPRVPLGASLSSRVMALLLDPTCEVLVISATPAEIEREGFPIDRCDLALVFGPAPVPEAMRRLIQRCAATVIDGLASGFERILAPLLKKVLSRKAPQ